MNKKLSFVIFLVVFSLSIVIFFLFDSGEIQQNGVTPTPTPAGTDTSDLIKVSAPLSDQSVSGSPLVISGEARGYWFFEASFPARIYDANGIELGLAVVQADGEWMTENFVKFNTVINFKKPATDTGVLVLEKDNPSGLPEHDAQLRIPLRFDLANWKDEPANLRGCKVGGCSSQLCIDESQEDLATTCEYKEEYACYKSAKCERQEDGQCGWTPTEELVVCLQAAWEKEDINN